MLVICFHAVINIGTTIAHNPKQIDLFCTKYSCSGYLIYIVLKRQVAKGVTERCVFSAQSDVNPITRFSFIYYYYGGIGDAEILVERYL